MPRATLTHWMVRCGVLIQPLINLMRDELLGGDIIHCDETPVQVLGEVGRAAQAKSFMWVQVGGEPERRVVLFDYDPSRGGAIPKRLLGDFSGYLLTDGYEGYGPVCRANGITQVGCWAHARRKFDEVLKAAGINPRKTLTGKPPPKARKAVRALGFIRQLFAIEHRLREDGTHTRYRVRQAESVAVLEGLRAGLDEQLPSVPPSTALGRALGYLDAQWPKLSRFLEDGRLELTNNRAENAIRPFVLGRKTDSLAPPLRVLKRVPTSTAWLKQPGPAGSSLTATCATCSPSYPRQVPSSRSRYCCLADAILRRCSALCPTSRQPCG